MSLLRLAFLNSLLVATLPAAAQEKQIQLAYTHVTIIDCTGGPAKPDMTVIVTGERISALGQANELTVPEGARVIDCSGKFMIPGLWDMHVHGRDWASPLFLANGVTGRRLMAGNLRDVSERDKAGLTDDQGDGKAEFTDFPVIPNLRSSVASPIIDGPTPVWIFSIAVHDAEQARQVVRDCKRQRFDFLKVYDRLPRDAFFALAEEAAKQEIRFAGHVPRAVTAAEASDAGQATIEHLTGIYIACSSVDKTQRQSYFQVRDAYDQNKAGALFARFVKNKTWQVPTLTVLKWPRYADRKEFTHDRRMRFIPIGVVRKWRLRAEAMARSGQVGMLRRYFEQDLQVVGQMHKAGVRIMAGTDTTNPFCMPGFSLHDELALLVEAGLSPMESLQTATKNPAEHLGRLNDFGTIDKGPARGGRWQFGRPIRG